MELAWLNELDAADIVTDSEIASLPVTNVQHPHIVKQWRTASGVNAAYLLADLGSQKAIDVLAILGTNLTPTAQIRVRASNADPTAIGAEIYDSTLIGAGVIANYPQIYHKTPAQKTARYWRIDISDAGVADNLHIGRVFLGPCWTPSNNRSYGWDNTWLDGSQRDKSRGGQTYINQGPRTRQIRFVLSFMSQAEMYDNAFELARNNGLTEDVLVLNELGDGYSQQKSIFGLVVSADPLVQEQTRIFRQRYTIEERL